VIAFSNTESDFLTAFRGRFVGILRWEQFDTLLETISARAEKGWYVYHVGESPPTEPLSSELFRHVLQEINILLRKEHEHDYCGIVYANSLTEPSFVKVFDPNHLGSGCGTLGIPVLPGWVLSLLKPVDLPTAFPPPNNRRRWWKRVFE